jgi:hypothetical protein
MAANFGRSRSPYFAMTNRAQMINHIVQGVPREVTKGVPVIRIKIQPQIE